MAHKNLWNKRKILDFEQYFVIIEMMFFNLEEVYTNEDDIPTKKEIKS